MTDTDSRSQRIDDSLQPHVARAFNFDEPPDTFEAFWRKMMHTFADALGRGVSVEDLCTTDDSPHRATVNGETHHYQCVTDAFLLGSHLDEAVTVRTVSPVSETELVVEFDADGVVAAPEDAVLSFGVERSVDAPDGPVTPAAMYGRFCPYSKAFASRAEYERWAEAHPTVVSDVQPLGDALALQARLLADADPFDAGTRTQDHSGDGCSC